MAPQTKPSPPQSWTVIAIAFAVFGFFQLGALAAYAFFTFDAHYTCDRPRDSCEVEHVKPFWRDVTERFRPSQLVEAKHVRVTKASWVALVMAGGEPEIRIHAKADEHLAARLNAFIADPAQLRLEYVIEANVFDYFLVGMLEFFSLIPFYGASSMALARIRAV